MKTIKSIDEINKHTAKIICKDTGEDSTFSDIFTKVGDGRYLVEKAVEMEYGGGFCPYCSGLFCKGECHEPEYVGYIKMLNTVKEYLDGEYEDPSVFVE